MKKNLRNIVTRVVANENINVDQAGEIKKNILNLMENEAVAEFSFKSSWKSLNITTKFKISLKHDEIFIDPNLLFQRLTAIGKNSKVSLEHLFKFELSPFPAALGKSPTEMHSPDTPKLVESLKKFSNPPNIIVNNVTQYILDGGNLIYKMGNWKKTSFSRKLLCGVLLMLRRNSERML